jgi:hypothetical protein
MRPGKIKMFEQLVQLPSWEVRVEVLQVIFLMAKFNICISYDFSFKALSRQQMDNQIN